MGKRKKLKTLLVVAVFLVGTVCLLPYEMAMANGLPVQWEKTFGGYDGDYGYSVEQTADGGYIIAGETWSYGAGESDVYLIKTDSLGNELWSRTFGGVYEDSAWSVQQTTDGGYIIAGETDSYGAGYPDVYLVKTDSAGNMEWEKSFGEKRYTDRGRSVQQTFDGGYIIGGVTAGSAGAEYWDVYLIKTDSAGNIQWQKTFGGADSDGGWSVQQTTDGGYIIAGWTYSYAPEKTDVLLVKTDSAGNMEWQKTFGGNDWDTAYAVQQAADGGYIITGYTDSYGAGDRDVYLIKTNSAGNMEWQKTFDTDGSEKGYSVKQTVDGGYIVAGYTYYCPISVWHEDVYLIKTDSGGNMEWQKTLGGDYDQRGISVRQTTDGGYIVTGWYYYADDPQREDVYLIKLKGESIGPVASFTYSPESPLVGEEITFDASDSNDPDGTIVSYEWDFGDANSASGQVVTHTYSEPNEYTVTLTVTDNDGLKDSLSKFITVKRPVLLVHGINADSSTWNTMIPYLEAEGYVQNENLFTIDLKGHDIKGYGQQVCNKLKEIKSNTGATKVDIVAHSMGGLASRWCIQKLDGDKDLAKLIMLGTPNHGALGFSPEWQSSVWWVPSDQDMGWDIFQMHSKSDFLAELNYNESHFDANSWLIKDDQIDDQISSGYTVLAGSEFETAEMFWNTYPGNEGFIPKSPYKGDGVVGVRSAKLTSVPCYQYNVKHAELNDGSDVIQDVIHLLNNEPVEHGGACHPSPRDSNEPSLWQWIRIKTNELILKGTIKMFEVILDTMPMAEIGIGYPGSELNLTLTTPGGIVIDPAYASSDPNIDFTYDVNSTDNLGSNYDEKYYTISNPETGSWTIEVTAVNVPPEGEKFSVGAMLKSDLTLLARTRDNIYSFPSGEYVILEAFLWDGDLLNYPGTQVEGTIEKPDGTKEIIAFRDDGTNGDSIPGDGVFTYNYTDTMANEMYYADINANSDSFARQTQLIFSINMLLDGVNFADYAVFADRWMDQSCTHASWCNGADLNKSGEVDIYDLGILAEYWLAGVSN